MNRSSDSLAKEEAAAAWAARLDSGAFTIADREALETWLAADSQHRPLLADFCQFSADLETTLPALVAEGRVDAPVAPPPRRRPSPAWRGWAFAGSLAAAAAIALAWVAFPRPVTPTIERVATAATQRQTVTLADGSQVELNAHTSIEFTLTKHERRARLADGQAFFSVAKDPSRPFIVETPAGSVRVTGTHFDVRADPSAMLEVTVEEGSVQVRLGENTAASAQAIYALKAGNHLTAHPAGVVVEQLSTEDVSKLLAWREGMIVFERTPLAEALARFARYHGRGITATSDTANLAVVGRYSLDDLDDFFASLEEILPVRVTHELSGTVIVRSRKKA